MPRFLAKRALRLYPAFIVASVISVFIVGPLGATVAGDYFRELNLRQVLLGMLVLRDPHTPAVFAGTPVGLVNGSMWNHFIRGTVLSARNVAGSGGPVQEADSAADLDCDCRMHD